MLSKAITGVVFIYLIDLPIFQGMILLKMSLFKLCYSIDQKPFYSRVLFLQEICNDSTVLMFVYSLYRKIDKALPHELILSLGWFQVITCLLNFTIHLAIISFCIVIDWKKLYQMRKIEKEKQQYFESNKEEWTKLKDQCPGEFVFFEKKLLENEIKDLLMSWSKQRKYLIKLGVKIDELPEEIEYRQNI